MLTLQKLFRSFATQTDVPFEGCKHACLEAWKPPASSTPLHVGTQTNSPTSDVGMATTFAVQHTRAITAEETTSQAENIQGAEATDAMLPAPGGESPKQGAQSVLEAASGSELDTEATAAFHGMRTPAQERDQPEACAPVASLRLSFGRSKVATKRTLTPNRNGKHGESTQHPQQEADDGGNAEEPTPKQSDTELEEDEQNERALLSHIEKEAAALDGDQEGGEHGPGGSQSAP